MRFVEYSVKYNSKTFSLAFLCGQKTTVQMETLNIEDEFGCRRKRPLLIHLVNSETKGPL